MNLLYAGRVHQFLSQWQSLSFNLTADGPGPDIQRSSRSKTAESRIAPICFRGYLNVLTHWRLLAADIVVSCRLLRLMSHNIEGEFEFVSHAHQTVKSRRGFHFEIATIDVEFSLRSEIVTGDRYFRRNCDLPRNAM